MELYNEELTDLLSADNEAKLRLLEDKNGINVQGLEEYMVKSTSEIYQASTVAHCLATGLRDGGGIIRACV